ncbi:phosphoglycerate dehydrogenase [bacterium]|nr:3-phosphoglycerate dehydrogenase [bacterium]MBU3954991.1 phosphoglycerate dehydrogenase [bacterium]MBU4134416.1 phosphoglycerate dehydrogenase [bacterium]
MHKILTLNKIAEEGLAVLPADAYETGPEVKNPEAVILRSFKMHDMDLPVSLLAIGRAGSGVNNIPVELCSKKGIVIFNTPGANANAVKELALAGLLLASRDIAGGIAYALTLKGKGKDVPGLIEKNKNQFAGAEIKDKTLGVVGLGKIGVMIANSAYDLGMKVIGCDPFISIESAWGLSRNVCRATQLDKLLVESDYISLHMPLNDSTRGLINAEKFSRMKKGVKLLNFSRGEIVNADDLAEALKLGKVSRYVTDFPDAQVLDMENVIAIPHLGASTGEAETNCAVMAASELRDFIENGNIKNSVNYPDCELEPNADFRMLVMNKNIPNMVGQISSILAKDGINIVEMLNKSKGDYAYCIIDLAQKPGAQIIEDIHKIDGVIKTRIIQIKK